MVDRLPDQPGVVVALGAGHGFKFASVLGRIAAELGADGTTPSAPELGAFRIDRPILLETRSGDVLDGLSTADAPCGPRLASLDRVCHRTATERSTRPEVRGGCGPRQRRTRCDRRCALD